MLDAIFFDHDGTLARTEERQHAKFKRWAEVNSVPWKPEWNDVRTFRTIYNEAYAGGDLHSLYGAFGLPYGPEPHPVWAFHNEFVAHNPVELYEGIPEMLEKIHEIGAIPSDPLINRRVRIGLNTNNSWKACRKDLLRAHVLKYFDTQVTSQTLDEYIGMGNSDSILKPSKISVARMLLHLDSEGPRTIHVGDTIGDLIASHDVLARHKKESLITVGVSWGYDGEAKLREGANLPSGEHVTFDYIVQKPSEIVEIFEQYVHER